MADLLDFGEDLLSTDDGAAAATVHRAGAQQAKVASGATEDQDDLAALYSGLPAPVRRVRPGPADAPQAAPSEADNSALLEELQRIKAELARVKEEHEKLVKQNDILIKNISCLYTTAKMEIERKDAEIARLTAAAAAAAAAAKAAPVARSSGSCHYHHRVDEDERGKRKRDEPPSDRKQMRSSDSR